MRRTIGLVGLCTLWASCLVADDVTFKSDVTLSRVDAQVVDREGRAITGLQATDFVLRVDGHVQPIKTFENESVPVDILLLLDVSGSMRPHVQRIADAAQQAFNVLAKDDRLGIMVFDTRARERLGFTSDRSQVTSELNRLLRFERFDGGTRITSALIEAASYMQRHARPDARRAVVILTDDETQDAEDETRVESALSRGNALLSFLRAPYEPPTMGRMPGHGRRGGVGFPGGGIGFPGGGIGFPGGGGGWPGGRGTPGVGRGSGPDPSHSAGTETIARDSGGDTMSVDEASSLEDTLSRLRQRYALHFYMPGDTQAEARHSVRVDLSSQARIRFADADVRSRRVFISGSSSQNSGPTVVTHQTAPSVEEPTPASETSEQRPQSRRRVAVNEDSSSGPVVDSGDSRNAGTSTQGPQATSQSSGGWPRANPK